MRKNMYQRIKDLREDADLSQRQLVEILGMHRTTYANYETGKREPPLFFVIMLAEYYNVSLDYIAGFTNVKTPLPQARGEN
jgi:transcriptional regulator with XRE-family HTH domain